jgi:hypothetical protein
MKGHSKLMSYQVSWIIPNHVLYIRYTDDLTLDDLRDSSRLMMEHLEVAYRDTPQNVITGVVDIREADLGSLFRSIMTVVVKQIADVIDPRIWKAKSGFVILITSSEYAKTAVSLVVKLSSQPMTTVATLDEALTVIASMYPELQTQIEDYKKHHLSVDINT